VSGEDLTYFDQEKDERFHPYVIEPAAGVDRAALAFLLDAYTVEEAPNAKGEMEKRTVLKLHKDLAPIKVAVLPLSRNERLVPKAREVFDLLKGSWMCDYDDAGSIGRRYRRQDEVGTPFCVTVDFESLDDNAVTIRDRDTMSQDRLPVDALSDSLDSRLTSGTRDG
jgi:glycyl-tRNA synthetase